MVDNENIAHFKRSPLGILALSFWLISVVVYFGPHFSDYFPIPFGFRLFRGFTVIILFITGFIIALVGIRSKKHSKNLSYIALYLYLAYLILVLIIAMQRGSSL